VKGPARGEDLEAWLKRYYTTPWVKFKDPKMRALYAEAQAEVVAKIEAYGQHLESAFVAAARRQAKGSPVKVERKRSRGSR
jgi:hypothetical protein